MRRVSSRQRLVSWDAFEADAPNSDCDDSSIQEMQDESFITTTSTPTVGCKRVRHTKSSLKALFTCNQILRHVIPDNEERNKIHLNDVTEDAFLHIFSFLEPSDARNVAATCNTYHELLLSRRASHLWVEWCLQKWPMLRTTQENSKKLTFRDDLKLPTVMGSSKNTMEANLSLLLGLASKSHPESVDHEILAADDSSPSNFVTHKQNGVNVVQYKGPVGQGEQYFRSDLPLPRPKDFKFASRRKRCSIFPMVAPHVISSAKDDGELEVHLTPRLVSYFEISILPKNDVDEDYPRRAAQRSEQHDDCVAIGVAAAGSQFGKSRLPGWDAHSYGYHGDDGDIFHGSGYSLGEFGPRYGPGDTVGCGIDYAERGIFFTLNGEFLGYAWREIESKVLQQNDFYPAVGVDTNCPIACNFGDRPYSFNLTDMVRQSRNVVQSALSPLLCTARGQGSRHGRKLRGRKLLARETSYVKL